MTNLSFLIILMMIASAVDLFQNKTINSFNIATVEDDLFYDYKYEK